LATALGGTQELRAPDYELRTVYCEPFLASRQAFTNFQ